ncbi:hypothetical protein GCM10009838_66180 [Catenulispora subtropica]|uniref:Transposase n=1 Tax=Catenulispora subtropica TaxID=450798 RepID=A0ABN2SX27_9ACTN
MNRFASTGETEDPCGVPRSRACKVPSGCRMGAASHRFATGIVEGAARHLIADRLDIAGACWSLTGAEAVLKLRALISNGDFEGCWRYHVTQEHQRHHTARYQQRCQLTA